MTDWTQPSGTSCIQPLLSALADTGQGWLDVAAVTIVSLFSRWGDRGVCPGNLTSAEGVTADQPPEESQALPLK